MREMQCTGLVSGQRFVDRAHSKTQPFPLTDWEKEWPVSIRPSDLVYCCHGLIDIQPYVPAIF